MKTDDKTVRVGVDGENSWTITGSGVKVEYLKPRPNMFNLKDIAHHTSQLCRFTGGTSQFYSVAQHAVFVADICKGVMDEAGSKQDESYWSQLLACLLHDAAETYVNDLASPLKSAIRGKYNWIEMGLLRCIFERFQIDWSYFNSLVKEADNIAIQVERYWLMPDHPDWPKVPEVGEDYTCPPFKDPITAAKEFEQAIIFAQMMRTDCRKP